VSDRLADLLLDLVRGLNLEVKQAVIEREDGAASWRLQARGSTGETWTAEHTDRYLAAVMLAELVGVELID